MALETFSHSVLNITNCVTIKLNTKNYNVWKLQFESFLCGQGLSEFINDKGSVPAATIPVPNIDGKTGETPNPDYGTWVRVDQMIRAWIMGSISKEMLNEIGDVSITRQIWLSLERFFDRASSSRLFELQRHLQTVSKGDKNTSEYLKDVKVTCDQLALIGSPISDKMKIFTALHGLGREFEPIKTVIENSLDGFPILTLEEVIPKLCSFDDRLLAYDSTSGVTPHMAFNTQRFQPQNYYDSDNKGRGNSFGRGRSCYSRGRNSYSTIFYQQISYGSTIDENTQDNIPTCQICGKKGHLALKCWHRFDNLYQYEEPSAALAAMRITEVTDTQAMNGTLTQEQLHM